MITRSTKTIFAALVLLALMAFIAVSIPHPLDPVDTVNEQHVKETTAGGSGMPIGTYVLAEFNDGKFALFFKECHICSIPFRQVGPGWGQGQFPGSANCDADSTVPGCSPTQANVSCYTDFAGFCWGGQNPAMVISYHSPTGYPFTGFDVDYKRNGGSWQNLVEEQQSSCDFTWGVSNGTFEGRVIFQSGYGNITCSTGVVSVPSWTEVCEDW
jgi:hypothetical protein